MQPAPNGGSLQDGWHADGEEVKRCFGAGGCEPPTPSLEAATWQDALGCEGQEGLPRILQRGGRGQSPGLTMVPCHKCTLWPLRYACQ